jgi:uncharacterized membrane protein
MPYRALFQKLWFDVRASYWFIPSCLVVAAVGLAVLCLHLDNRSAGVASWLPEGLTNTQIDGARATLAVIAQSVISVTGVMFSVTMVAVSFASGNFGPRLVGNFMRDRGNQWSLGLLIATFVYALIILRSVQSPVDGGMSAFVPQLSIVVAMALALLSVFVMIYFVHHVPETINVSNISANLGKRYCKALTDTAHSFPGADAKIKHPNRHVFLKQAGYVQRLEIKQLDDIASRCDLDLQVTAPPGRYVHVHQSVLGVTGDLSDTDVDELQACFALGTAKTEEQNILFLAEQQVEMIARALSPGVNDPYTAINCLNWLAAGLAAGSGAGDAFGPEGTDRVSMPTVDLRTILEATFGAAYPYVTPDDMVLAHWSALLDELETGSSASLSRAVRAFRKSLTDTN